MMHRSRRTRPGPWRGVAPAAAALALVTVAALAGGPAHAATHPAASPPPRTGNIGAVVGGSGGPDPATHVALSGCGLTAAGGYLYLGDGGIVRRVNEQTGALTNRVGGDPQINSFNSRGHQGQWSQVRMSGVCGVAVDGRGNLLIADSGDNRIQVAAVTIGRPYGKAQHPGHVYSIAGDGLDGVADSGRPAVHANVGDPNGLALDGQGNLIISSANDYVYVLAVTEGTFYGQSMIPGDIYTVAGGGKGTGDGILATQAFINQPAGVATDQYGNLIIPAAGGNKVEVVAASTATYYGIAMTAGHIYTVAGTGVAGFSGDGGPATSAELDKPDGVAVDSAGNLIVADLGNNRIRVIAAATGTYYGQAMTAGHIYTVAGTGTAGFSGAGGPATAAEIDDPSSTTVDQSGNLVFAVNNRLLAVAAAAGTYYGQAMTADDLYAVAGNGKAWSGSGGPAKRAVLDNPQGVATEAGTGNLAVANTIANEIWFKAATTGTFYGHPMTAGHVYDVAGYGLRGFSGDGGEATKAKLNLPGTVAFDHAGNLLIADHDRIRVVAAATGTSYGVPMTAGHIYTIAGTARCGFSGDGGPATAAKLCGPAALAVDPSGNVLIGDYSNARIRVIAAASGTFYGQAMTAGDIYTIAGGGTATGNGVRATSAALPSPVGLAFDAAGNLIVTERAVGQLDGLLRVIAAASGTYYGRAMTAGDIYTVAGGGTGTASGVPATSVDLNSPNGVAVDDAGNLLLADTGDNIVQVVAEADGTFYGVPMTTGNIYTIAGNGTAGLAGDATSAARSELDQPRSVTYENHVGVVFADTANSQVREVGE